MTQQPKKQHTISAGCLTLFADKENFLFIRDLENSKSYKLKPDAAFYEKDFQTLTSYIGLDPYFLEKNLAKEIEEEAIIEIKKIIASKQLPASEERFSYVINLMGLFAMRNSPKKKQIIHKINTILLQKFKDSLIDESTYNKQMANVALDVPYHRAKEIWDAQDNYKLIPDHDNTVMTMINLTSDCVDLLAQRNWMLVESQTAELITSDHPVNIIPTHPIFGNIDPTFNSIHTLVIFPLSPKFALIGSFFDLPSYSMVDDKIVESINSGTTYFGASKICSSKEIILPNKDTIISLQQFHISNIIRPNH